METTTTKPSIFLTDYASYNEGSQFEFGHWVDLTDFNDADELNDYIVEHLAECDRKRPLGYGSIREEVMITDYEGFPEQFYCESGCDFKRIYKYLEIDYDNIGDSEKIDLWNEYCQDENLDDEILNFDDDFFETYYHNKTEAARAVCFGKVNWNDDFIQFNGYGNIISMSESEALESIDDKVLIEWLMENK
jgi:hypothetical protein